MRKIFTLGGIVVLSALFTPFNALAHSSWLSMQGLSSNISTHGGVRYGSEYVYRAQKRAQSNISGYGELSYMLYDGDIYVKAWGLRPFASDEEFATELRLSGGYRHWVTDMIMLDFGSMYYSYPDRAGLSGLMNREREIYAGINVNVVLRPELYFVWNFDRKMWLLEGAISHSFDLVDCCMPCFFLEPSASVGYLSSKEYSGSQLWGRSLHANDYYYLMLKLDLTYRLGKYFAVSVGPRLAWNSDRYPAIIRDLRTFSSGANELGNHDTMFWVAAAVTFDF